MIDAHGIGGQGDLPVPLSLAVSGAVAALVLSFAVLIVAWRTSRYDGQSRDLALDGPPWPRQLLGRITGAVVGPTGRVVLRTLGFALFLFTAATAIWGVEQVTNPFFGIVYIWWWVGVPFLSLLLGPVWKAISPIRTINAGLHRLTGGDPALGLRDYPAWLGHWPAAIGLYAFVWLELVYDRSDQLADVRLWCAVYVAVMLIGCAVFGERWAEHADPFEVLSTLVGKLSPWAVVEGRVVLRSPLANLATVEPRPGLVAVVAVLFGSTAFDSFSESAYWVRTVYDATLTANQLNNAALLAFCVAAGVVFSLGAMATGVAAGTRRTELPRQLAHSLVPIIAAYLVAHYLTLFLDGGWQTLARASDPFGQGWNLFGTAGLTPAFWFSYHPTLLASIKVIAVVVGHVTAAVAAHDRSLTVLPPKHQVLGQLPLLVTMVGFTAGGLYLLFNA